MEEDSDSFNSDDIKKTKKQSLFFSEGLGNNDSHAIMEIYKTLYPKTNRLAIRWKLDEGTQKDIFQDTIKEVYFAINNKNTYQEDGRFIGFFLNVYSRICFKRGVKEQKILKKNEDPKRIPSNKILSYEEEGIDDYGGGHDVFQEPEVFNSIQNEQSSHKIHLFLRSLSEKEADFVDNCILKPTSLKDYANNIGETESAVKQRKKRLIDRLKGNRFLKEFLKN